MKDKYRVIYKPRGAALEYSPLALNLAVGCEHGCKYCYGPPTMKRTRDSFCQPKERKDVLKKLKADIEEMRAAGDDRHVLLCFVTDPYQPNHSELTRNALELFARYQQPFQVLTKGGMRAARDFDLYGKRDKYAATIVFADDRKREQWEPNAATVESRIESLKTAKEKGIATWVSLEPVIEPAEALRVIAMTRDYVDHYKVGKINNFKTGLDPDWQKFTHDAVNMLETYGKDYYVKNSLKKYL